MASFPQTIKSFFTKYDIYLLLVLAVLLRAFGRGSSTYGVAGELYRDMAVVFNFLHNGQWPLLGPSSSLGGFYFGAIYYYLLTPLIWLFKGAPYAATFVSALFSIASVFVIFRLVLLWSGNRNVARLAGFMLAISVWDIQNAYYVSNPNFLPFFVLCFMYCLTCIVQGRRQWRYYIAMGVSFGIATQLHATALLILPLVLLIAVAVYRKHIVWLRAWVSLAAAAVLYAPYAIYEMGNHYANTAAIAHLAAANFGFINPFSAVAEASFGSSWLVAQSGLYDFLSLHTDWSLLFMVLFAVLLSASLLNRSAYAGTIRKYIPGGPVLLILSLWGGIGAIMFLLFQNATQPFYFLVMWPLPLMLVAWWLAVVSSRSKSLARGMLGIYAIAQIIQLSYFYPKVYVPRFSHSHLLEDFNIIPAMAEGRSFTIVNQFAEINQFHYYEKITGIEPRLAKSNAELVFIMCEDEKSPVCRNKGQNYKLEEPPVFINGLYIFMFRKNNSAP